jgi:hypothetical protein
LSLPHEVEAQTLVVGLKFFLFLLCGNILFARLRTSPWQDDLALAFAPLETLRLAQNLQVSSSRCFDRELEKIKIIENEDMF